MKAITTLLLLCLALFSFSQKADPDYSPTQYRESNCRSSFEKIFLPEVNSSDDVKQYLLTHLNNLKNDNIDLVSDYVNESPGGFHYSFHQTFKGVKIYQSEVKVNMDKHHTIFSLFDNSENVTDWNLDVSSASGNSVIAIHPSTNLPVLCKLIIENNHTETLVANGETIFAHDMNSYAAAPDSLVSAKVYKPDPLTTSMQNYGAPYNDDNNNTNASLNAELKTVSFLTTFNGTDFVLENQYVHIVDIDAPTLAPATSTTPQFLFVRSQDGFEDVNAFYHLNILRTRIHSLGFTTADHLLDVDTHAWGGADNSSFSYSTSPPQLRLGIGGVDDAEDADVPIHEYGHFISYNAANATNNGAERNALDEGFGDYLAATYSKSLSSYNNNEIFNWDGHNEFWNGRVMNTTRIYPTDLQTSIYKNGEMWSAALYDISNEIGRDATDSIIIQAHYAYASNISMADGGRLLLQADTLITNGVYHCPVYKHLLAHGFVAFDPNNPCGISSVQEDAEFNIQFLQNGNTFSVMNKNQEAIELQIISLSGQQINSLQTNKARFDYNDENLSAGIYLVTVKTKSAVKTFKWVKAK